VLAFKNIDYNLCLLLQNNYFAAIRLFTRNNLITLQWVRRAKEQIRPFRTAEVPMLADAAFSAMTLK
jgi:hypothetical protein